MIATLLAATIKVSLVLTIGLLAVSFLRKASAALRHWVLAAAIFCSLLMPALQFAVPSWDVPVGVGSDSGPIAGSYVSPLSDQATAAVSTPPPAHALSGGTAWRIVATIWAAGTAWSLALLLIGLARLAWLASRSTRVEHGNWHRLTQAISLQYGLRRPVRVLQSHHPTLLVTWGIVRPRIIVPAGANHWSRDRIHAVLCHELAHIQRGDWAVQMAAELLRSLHWFNPLVWVVCRRLRDQSEHACDDAVLNMGVNGQAYATHLLDLARRLTPDRAWSPAPAIVHPSNLERRVRAMLNARLNRRPIPRFARVTIAIALVGITLPIAGLAQTTFSTFSGSVVDQMERLLPGARLILTNTQTEAKYEVRSDGTGRFAFVGLPPGEYALETSIPGFAPLRGTVTVSGQDLQQDIRLEMGGLEETVTVTDTDPAASLETRSRRDPPACGAADATGPGGRIRPPIMIQRLRPTYPQNVAGAKVEEVVVLKARIATDGSIKDVEVVPPAHPVFAGAAVDAIRQWQFDETLLNCVPVEVSMKVTARFRRQQ